MIMARVFVNKPLNMQQFLSGTNPDLQFGQIAKHFESIDAMQEDRTIAGDGKYAANCVLICKQTNDVKANMQFSSKCSMVPLEPENVNGVLIQVWGLKNKSSFMVKSNAKSGKINWDALRKAIAEHIANPRQYETTKKNNPDVSMSSAAVPSRIKADFVMAAWGLMTLHQQENEEAKSFFMKTVSQSFASSKEDTELSAIRAAVEFSAQATQNKYGIQLPKTLINDAQNVTGTLYGQNASLYAKWCFSRVSDVNAISMYEWWSGAFSQLQRQFKIPENKDLAMVKACTKAIEMYEQVNGLSGTQPFTASEYETLKMIRSETVAALREKGHPDQDIAEMMSGQLRKWHNIGTATLQTQYQTLVARAYATCLFGQEGVSTELSNEVQYILRTAMQSSSQDSAKKQFVDAMYDTSEQIQQLLESKGFTDVKLPELKDVSNVVAKIRLDTSTPDTYPVSFLGLLPNGIAEMVNERYFDNLLIANIDADVYQPGVKAITLLKTLTQVMHEESFPPKVGEIAKRIRADVMCDAVEVNVNENEIYDAMHDIGEDFGDDPI